MPVLQVMGQPLHRPLRRQDAGEEGIAACCVLVTLAVGVPLALALARAGSRWRN
jgi:hypothetical protein